MALDITSSDKVIDPACGTGGFLGEALRYVAAREFPKFEESWNLIKWANDNLYGVDKDDIGVKLTRAMMVAMRDGSTHVLLGDAIRTNEWPTKYTKLRDELSPTNNVLEQFTVVVTNPPFGEDLKITAADCMATMRHYIGLIRKDAASDYGVSFPDFPGVVTAGKDLDDARAMADEALALHVEGMIANGEAIPEPSSLEEVMADPENRDGVAILVDLKSD